MGQNLCCMKRTSPGDDHNKKARVTGLNVSTKINLDRKNKQVHCSFESKVKFSTLEDYLVDSPEMNRCSQCITDIGDHQLQIVHEGYQKIHPASPDVTTGFYTPRISFSEKMSLLGRVTEENEEGSISGRVKKRVSFRLPDETDIIVFYPSEDTFEDF
ncbi:hypothetical protein POM88_002736 [Heracleum sosnowskyi]|uniref:Uncharacterized protein n=1 Tax=Heracleum sosnowskyi TaxID=360622 RepID=A0AAD8JG86_9APIA|nr:hypothetical protein POM88_002736 [Heracleum sosnowskyi]